MISSSAPKQIQTMWAHDQSIIHHPVFDCNRRLSPEPRLRFAASDGLFCQGDQTAVDRVAAIPRYDVFGHMNHTHTNEYGQHHHHRQMKTYTLLSKIGPLQIPNFPTPNFNHTKIDPNRL